MKNKVKYFLITALAVTLAVLFTACEENFTFPERPLSEEIIIPVEEIIGIPTGSRPRVEITLSGTVMPANATNKRIVWSIKADGGTGAELERNKLFTESEGNVTVTATIQNGSGENVDYTQDFNIVISSRMIAVSSITGIPDTLPAGFAGDYELRGKVNPSNALNKTIVYSLKDAGTTGASIYGNILTIESPGTVVITATVENGRLSGDFTQDFAIVIPYISVTDISGIPDEVTLGDYVLHGVVTPSEASNKNITWSVTDAGATGATIVNGNTLRTTATGTVTVMAAIADGVSYGEDFTKDFTITISIIAVTNITGIPSTIGRGDYELNGVVTPSGASNAIVWTVANAGATGATINGNILTTTAAGTVTIRATIANGVSLGVDYTKDFTITIIKIVYAAGTYQDDNYNTKACYWKNEELFTLGVPAGTINPYVTDIVVVNGIPYISGGYTTQIGNVEYACYWVNGEYKALGAGLTYSIAAEGSTVYILGETTNYEPCYWKIEGNTTHHTILNASALNETNNAAEGGLYYLSSGMGCFVVNNGNLYIPFGYNWTVDGTWDDYQIKNYLYVNGNFTEFDSSYSAVYDIAILNGTVYMAGYNEDNKPFYLAMEGSSKILDTGGSVYSIVVQNGALFFYGYDANSDTCYWNASGTKTALSTAGYQYNINNVAFSDGDVYIGYFGNTEGGGYRVIGGTYTQLYGANGTVNVQVAKIAVQ